MNISSFFNWFLTQFINIGTNMIEILDNIIIAGNVTLLDFMITITIIGIFINIILTLPKNANRMSNRYERKHKNDSEQ